MSALTKTLFAGACALAVSGVVTGAANAALITSDAGLVYEAFPTVNYFGTGPQSYDGITWTSTNASYQGGSVFGYNGGYGFAGNGYTSQTMTGLNDSFDYWGVVDTMTFRFATPQSAVGAVLNWVPSSTPVTFSAYNSSNILLDTLVVSSGDANLVTPNSFYGFSESTADISYITMTDGYLAAIGGIYVTTGVSAIPEPATWGLMIAGFGLIGATLRRRAPRLATA
jgi:hypothetical protein